MEETMFSNKKIKLSTFLIFFGLIFSCCILTIGAVYFFIEKGIITFETASQNNNLPQTQQIDVFIDLSVDFDSQGRAQIMGSTNLPNATILMVDVFNREGYHAQDKINVFNGKFQAGPFSYHGGGLTGESYTVDVLMPLPKVQPTSVKNIIGQKGEFLSGNLIVRDESGNMIQKIFTFNGLTPTTTPTVISTNVPTFTPAPVTIKLQGEGIGVRWSDEYIAISVYDAWLTDRLDYGNFSFYPSEGYDFFLVIDFSWEHFSEYSRNFEPKKFGLQAFTNDHNLAYSILDCYSCPIRQKVEPGQELRDEMIFEVKLSPLNFYFYESMSGILSPGGEFSFNPNAPYFIFRMP